MRTILPTLLALMLLCINVNAQSRITYEAYPDGNEIGCKASEIHHRMLENDPEYARKYQSANNYSKSLKSPQGTIHTIPVVVHVIHLGEAVGTGTNISDEQIQSAITALNRDFRMEAGTIGDGSGNTPVPGVDCEIEFCLAVRDPNGQPTTGINRVNGSSVTNYASQGIIDANEVDVKTLSRWDNRYYYNVWVVSEIDDNGGGAGTQGYAYFPTNPVTWNADKDGTVVLYNAFGNDPDGSLGYNLKSYTNLNRTMTHEIGHGLNLHHPFEGGSCSETDCTTQGDEVCDTPPTTQQTNCGTPACGGTQQVENYMDYTGSTCTNMFTQGQKDRMRTALEGPRAELLTSDACTPTNDLDAALNKIVYPIGDICATTFDPIVEIRNLGVQTLTSVTITFDIDGGAPQTFNWTGSLATNASEQVTLASMTTTAGAHTFNVSLSNPNGGTDEYTANDNATSNFTVQVGSQVNFTLVTDNFGSETTWTLTDSNSNTLYSGGPYTDGGSTTITLEFCLADGCYDFTINDSYGDGICCSNGSGSYTLTDAVGNTLASGGSFASTETKNFCIDSNPPVASFTADQTTICASNTINFTDTSTGSPGSWSWTFTGGTPSTSTDQNPAIVYNTPGTYDVTLEVTNANGTDTHTETAMITVGAALDITATGNNESCPGNCDGSGTVVVNSGTSPYTYSWTSGTNPNTDNVTDLCSGNYTVTVSDGAGCSTSANITISAPLAFNLTTSSTDASCAAADGTATVNVLGGTGPFTYAWDDPSTQSTSTATALGAGTYSVVVTDAAGCSASESATVNSTSNLSVSASMTNGVCGSGCNGSAMASGSGGQSPYTYSWDNGDNTASASNLCQGSYTVTVTDANGCTATSTVNIIQSGSLTISVSSIDASCGNSDGSATATVSSGSAPYSYLWDDGLAQTSPTASNLSPGNYNVTVSDASGCSASESVTVNNTDGPVISTTFSDESCFAECDGTASVMVTGGTSPYSYQWDDPNTQTNPSAFNLCGGSYTITVTDMNGCAAVETVNIAAPTEIILSTASNDATCGNTDGTAAVTATGGSSPYTYNWNTGETTSAIFNLGPGTYNVQVTDNNGCSKTASVSVTSANGPVISLSETAISCAGKCDGALTASVTGSSPYTYSWSGGETTSSISSLCEGTYSLEVTDNNGCVGTINTTLVSPTQMTNDLSSLPENCGNSDGMASVNVSGGTSPYTYLWSNGGTTATISNLASDPYTVTITDGNGCQSTGSVMVGNNTGPSLTMSNTKVSCNNDCDGSATVAATGGSFPYTYAWDDASNQTTATAINLCAGTYNVIVTDNAGCTATGSVTLNNPAPLTATTSSTDASCSEPNGTASVVPTGGTAPYSYDWSNGANSANIINLAGNVYTVVVTDENGCYVTATAEVQSEGGPSIGIRPTDATCYGACDGEATVNILGGLAPFTYSWNTSPTQTTSTITGLCPGIYGVTVTDANGCTSSANTAINQPNPILVDVSTTDENCGNGNGSATASADLGNSPYTYTWSTGDTGDNISGLSAGTHNVVAVDADGCANMAQFTINTAPLPTALVTNDVSICEGTSVALSASGGVSYSWSTGETTSTIVVTPTVETTYTVTTNDGFCDSNPASVTVSIKENPVTTVDPESTVICNGESITLNAGGGDTYLWNTNETDDHLTVSPTSTTTYSVIALKDGCQGEGVNVNIVVLAGTIEAQASSSLSVVSIPGNGGQVSFFNESGPADSYEWNFGDGFTSDLENPVHTYTQEGTYTVTFTVTNGNCDDTYEMTIIVINNVGIDDLNNVYEFKLYPNPNNGIVNLSLSNFKEHTATVQIFNSIGQLVFISEMDVANNTTYQLDLNNLASGIYDVTVSGDKHQTKHQKISVIK